MGIHEKEDVLALRIEAEIVCNECTEGSEWNEVTEDMLVTRSEVEDDDKLFFLRSLQETNRRIKSLCRLGCVGDLSSALAQPKSGA